MKDKKRIKEEKSVTQVAGSPNDIPAGACPEIDNQLKTPNNELLKYVMQVGSKSRADLQHMDKH